LSRALVCMLFAASFTVLRVLVVASHVFVCFSSRRDLLIQSVFRYTAFFRRSWPVWDDLFAFSPGTVCLPEGLEIGDWDMERSGEFWYWRRSVFGKDVCVYFWFLARQSASALPCGVRLGLSCEASAADRRLHDLPHAVDSSFSSFVYLSCSLSDWVSLTLYCLPTSGSARRRGPILCLIWLCLICAVHVPRADVLVEELGRRVLSPNNIFPVNEDLASVRWALFIMPFVRKKQLYLCAFLVCYVTTVSCVF